MKKRIAALLAAVLLCLSAGCAPKSTPLPESENFPMDLVFSSGAGAWSTHLTLYANGSFSGEFHDSNMGETGKDFPNGTVYFCTFSGQFTLGKPPDVHSTPMTLIEVTAAPAPKEQIADGVLYVAAGPYGLYNDHTDGSMSRSFVLYSPDTPALDLDESLLGWWPGRFEETPPETLNCWALWNTEAGTAFFTEFSPAN